MPEQMKTAAKSRVRTVELTVRIDCRDASATWLRFLQIVGELSVVVLGSARHDFPGGGLTGVIILAESHAAIHTWPEDGTAWVELATCGDPADLTRFIGLMSEWEQSAD